jgi:hypothetical protein
MYGLWFKKPMDIHDPTIIGREDTDQLKAIMHSHRALSKRAPNLGQIPRHRALSKRAPNLGQIPRDLIQQSDWRLGAVLGMLVILCAAYGGVHLSTWNFDFPTPLEQKLWRIACISTVTGSLLAPGIFLWSMLVFHKESVIDGTKETFSTFWAESDSILGVFALLAWIALLSSPLLLAARIFLVVESFISLRDVPLGVYATVSWSQYIPHI